jgi:cbb3-type cytochrome oxidase subunit 1
MLVYLCSPYSYKADEALMEWRYQENLRVLTELTLQGIPVFSPIVTSHNMSAKYKLPCTFDFWEKVDFGVIDHCSHIYVMMLPDWDKSIGVTKELEYAKKIGKEIVYLDMNVKKEVA